MENRIFAIVQCPGGLVIGMIIIIIIIIMIITTTTIISIYMHGNVIWGLMINCTRVVLIAQGEAECDYRLTSAINPQNHTHQGVLS